MSVFDIISEVSEKQIYVTPEGNNRMFGIMVGIVVKNYDQKMPGRVCVSIPVMDKEADVLEWVPVVMTSGGSGWGHYFMPEIGDQVILAFEQGIFERPYVIGCIPKDKDKFLKKAVDEKNKYKKIMTRNGTNITFEDDGQIKENGSEGDGGGDGEPGEKDRLTIQTALDTYSLVMDNEKKKVSLSDKEGKNKIVLSTEEEKGKLSIQVEKQLEIKIGDEVTLSMDGKSGNVILKAKKFTLEASDGIKLKTDGSAKINAANVMLEASSTLKAESSGVVQVSGSPIKIG